MNDETVYSLALFKQTEEGVLINSIKNLTEAEFNKYDRYIYELDKFSSEESLFTIIESNYDDLIERIEKHVSDYRADSRVSNERMVNIYIDINRLTLNFLSSVRTYLDHTETRFKREYGEDSEEVKLFKASTSQAFDNYFSYRFLSKLRNYAQHCGLPAGSVSMVSDADGEHLLFVLVRDELLQNFTSWGSKIKAEIQDLPAQFDMLPHLSLKLELLRGINDDISEMQLIKLQSAGNELLKLLIEAKGKGIGSVHIIETSGDLDSPNISMRDFPYNIISRITGINIIIIPQERQKNTIT